MLGRHARSNSGYVKAFDLFLQSGTLMISEKPIGAVIKDSLIATNCSACFDGPGEKQAVFKPCQECKCVVYCCEECRLQDYPMHQIECKRFKICTPQNLPNATVRFMCRMYLSTGMHERLFKLATREEKGTEEYSGMCLMATKIINLDCDDGDRQDVSRNAEIFNVMMDVARIMSLNLMTVFNSHFLEAGYALMDSGSFINHSCSPNAFASWIGSRMEVRMLRAIPKGTEITMSYVPTTNSTVARQVQLQNTFGFKCTCKRCKRFEKSDDSLGSYKCPNPACGSYFEMPRNISHPNPAPRNSYFEKPRNISQLSNMLLCLKDEEIPRELNIQCPKCECVHMNFENTIKKHRQLLVDADACGYDPSISQAQLLECCDTFPRVFKGLERILHPAHMDLYAIKMLMYPMYLAVQDYEAAYNIYNDMLQMYYSNPKLVPLSDPFIGTSHVHAGKLAVCIGSPRSVWHMQQAYRNLQISLGEEHAMFKVAKNFMDALNAASSNSR